MNEVERCPQMATDRIRSKTDRQQQQQQQQQQEQQKNEENQVKT